MLLFGGSGSGSGDTGLTIDQLTEGVSREGIQECLNQVKITVIDDATSNLQNTTELKEVLATYWVGTDADQFMANFDALVTEIVNSLESYYSQIENEFNKVLTDWEQFQSTNVTG